MKNIMMVTRINTKQHGFNRLEMVIITSVILLLFVIGVPMLLRFASNAKRITCASNLKNVGLGFQAWAKDHADLFPMQVSTNHGGSAEWTDASKVFKHFRLISNMISTPRILICPAEDKMTKKPALYFDNKMNNSNISYFIALNASNDNNSILAGDRNIRANNAQTKSILIIDKYRSIWWTDEMHKDMGNILYGNSECITLTNNNIKYITRSINWPVTIALPN